MNARTRSVAIALGAVSTAASIGASASARCDSNRGQLERPPIGRK